MGRRDMRKGGGYEVHILGDRDEPETVRSFGSDGMKALVFYTREVIVARRRGMLLLGETLPGIEPEVIDSFTPDPTDIPLRPVGVRVGESWVKPGAPIMVRLGDPEPAFARDQAAAEARAHEAELKRVGYWYALGAINGEGPLGILSDGDAQDFSRWYMHNPGDGVVAVWAKWSPERREYREGQQA